MKWLCLVALVVTLALTQGGGTDQSDFLKLMTRYPQVRKVNLDKLWGDAPELKITIVLRRENCTADDAPSQVLPENSCETNPKRDCSCFEERLKQYPYGFNQEIQPIPGGDEFKVFCSLLDGKLWTVIHQRMNLNAEEEGADKFYRTFTEYENGFGSLDSNHFTGLKNINQLTEAADMRLRIEMYDQSYVRRDGQFNTFRVGDQSEDYQLTIGDHSGVLGSSLIADSNGKPFSAKGNDIGGNSCPATTASGWWFADDCGTCNFNGEIGTDNFACDVGSNTVRATSVTFYVTPNDYVD